MAYGAKVSRRGFDVKTCADNELLFSSSFPLLKMHSTGTYTVPGSVGTQDLTTHILGYVPLYTIYYVNSGGESEFDPNSGNYVTADTSRLYIDTDYATTNSISEVRWTIYYLDLFSPVDYGSIKTTSTSRGGYSDYGIKATKEGADVSSTDKRDFSLDSSMRSIIVHSVINCSYVDPGGLPGPQAHNLGYPPFYLAYEKYDSDSLTRQIVIVDGPFNAVTDTDIILFATGGSYGATNSTLSFVVFKDPINLTI